MKWTTKRKNELEVLNSRSELAEKPINLEKRVGRDYAIQTNERK